MKLQTKRDGELGLSRLRRDGRKFGWGWGQGCVKVVCGEMGFEIGHPWLCFALMTLFPPIEEM